MFWLEEDIQPAIDLTIKVFGQPNQYIMDTDMQDVSIVTREFGILWTGDLPVDKPSRVQGKLNILSDTLNKRVFITNNQSFNFDWARVTSTNKLKRDPDIVY